MNSPGPSPPPSLRSPVRGGNADDRNLLELPRPARSMDKWWELESRGSVAWVSMAAGAENKPLPAELLLWREGGGLGSGEGRGAERRAMHKHTALLPGTRLPHGGPFLGAHFSWEDLSFLTVPNASLLAGICPLCRDLESLAPMVGVCAGLDCVSEIGQCPRHLELVLTWTLQSTLVTGPVLLSKPGLLHCRGLRLAQVSCPISPREDLTMSLTFPSS